MRRALPWIPIALLAACGTSVETSPQSSSSGGAGGGTGSSSSSASSASSASSSGATCVDPGGACTMGVQCVTPTAQCLCGGGALACHDATTWMPVSLPAPGAEPNDGACCAVEGMTCGGYTECGPICTCTGGKWSCPTPAACPPFTCPTTLADAVKLIGVPCGTEIGKVCQAGSGCSSATCTCTLDPATSAAVWSCVEPPC